MNTFVKINNILIPNYDNRILKLQVARCSLIVALILTFNYLLFTLSGCSRNPVIAQVGPKKIRMKEFKTELANSRRDTATVQEKQELLNSIIADEVLAQEALKKDLDDDIRVRVQIDNYRRRVLAQALRDKVLNDSVSDKALLDYYAKNKDKFAREVINVSHVMVRIPYQPTPAQKIAAEKKIEEAYSHLARGEQFPEVVKKYSDDKATRENEGRLGEIDRTMVDPDFYKNARNLKVGEYSEPVTSRFGYHIIKALADPRVITPDFERLKPLLRHELQMETMKNLQESLRKKIKVRINEKALEK